jgi:hypothetical protein
MSDFIIADEPLTTVDLESDTVGKKAAQSSTSEAIPQEMVLPTALVLPPPEEPLIHVPSTTVTLLDSAVRIELQPGMYKYVTYPDFISSLKTNLDEKDGSNSKKEEYYLPNGTFYFRKTERDIFLSMYYPECVRDINYLGNIRKSVLPNIVLSVKLLNNGAEWAVVDSRYFSTRDPLGAIPRAFIERSHGLPLLPFTNIYEDARMCFGTAIKISKFKLPDLRGVNSYHQVLFDAPFNNDLGLYALGDNEYRRDYPKWYEHLAKLAEDNKPFPYEKLRNYS